MAVSLAIATHLSSCIAVGPDFVHPAPPKVDSYTPEPLPGTRATSVPGSGPQVFEYGRDIPEQWWALFHSAGLDRLVREAIRNNPNFQATMSALRAAKEAVYAQQGKYFPVAQGNFNATRQQTPPSLTPIPASGASVFDLYTAQVTVTYLPDVWGLNRRTVESLQAQSDLQRFQVEAAYLTLTSNVVVAAITEASLRGQIAATNQVIAANTRMLDILQRQFNAGYANRADVAAQEAALAQARATLPPLRKQLAITRDLLAALLGRYPSDQPEEIFTLASLALPEDLPVSIPSQLVEQRPDVRAAQEQLHSASALIGVATANMLPNFGITANGGYQSTILAGLISPINAAWMLSGNVTQTLFDGLSLLHQRRQAEANYDQAAWLYRTAVIGAVQNVADALRALEHDADALRAAIEFERAAKISQELARQQLEAGNVNIIFQLNAQITYLQAVIAVVQAKANRLADTAALFQALGGGWWNRVVPPKEKILEVGADRTFTLTDRNDITDAALGPISRVIEIIRSVP
jgi:NodT family efflux transporter outer membrane factor (OMF) lipoprotein